MFRLYCFAVITGNMSAHFRYNVHQKLLEVLRVFILSKHVFLSQGTIGETRIQERMEWKGKEEDERTNSPCSCYCLASAFVSTY